MSINLPQRTYVIGSLDFRYNSPASASPEFKKRAEINLSQLRDLIFPLHNIPFYNSPPRLKRSYSRS